MFLTGIISTDLEPFLDNLWVLGNGQGRIPIKAILDTGFNGELALPQVVFSSVVLQPLGIKTFELANGQITKQKIYIATLVISKKLYPVETTFTRSEIALVGMELLRNRIAIFNLKSHKISVRT